MSFKLKNYNVEFIEWFVGFTDAEGCFQIRAQKFKNAFEFRFSIGLHLDDIEVLRTIKSKLEIGKISIYPERKVAVYNIISKNEIKIIIDLFTKYSLNSHKYLNFLDFKQAFILYNEPNRDLELLNPIIINIINNMNFKRHDYTMPISHYKITKNWLVGFIEGDGSFSYNIITKNVVFSITQKGNEDLLKEIAKFIYKYMKVEKFCNSIKIYSDTSGQFNLTVNNNDFLDEALIPLFNSVQWYSKKYLDFEDFKLILKIIQKGLHYLPEGEFLINKVIYQMNKGRLSSSKNIKIDRHELLLELNLFLEKPSNYVIKEGKIFIISLNRFRRDNSKIGVLLVNEGKVLKSFSSITECANFLSISRSTVQRKIQKEKKFSLNFTDKCKLIFG